MNKAKKFTKRHLQTINIFEYNIKKLLPSLKPELNAHTHQPLQLKTTYRNITYNYISDVTRGFEKIDYKKVYDILKKLYLSDLQQKVYENKGVKLHPIHIKYTPFSAVIQDQIQMLISNSCNMRESTKGYDPKSSNIFGKSSINNPFSSGNKAKSNETFLTQDQLQNLTFYIIHENLNKEEGELAWLNFVQKYEFTNIKYEEERPNQPAIVYSVAFSYYNEGSALSLNLNSQFLQKYFQESCLFVANKSIYLKNLVEQIKKTLRQKIESVSRLISNASFDNRHRRFLKLKNESFPIFQQLKSRSSNYLREISPNRKQNPYFMQNTVCRMMENNNYRLQDSWQALKYYFNQQKRLRDKYNWQSFREFHNINIFNYIGKDNTGRPVLLSRVRNCLISKIEDRDLFFDYHFYLFEVYLQDQMEGWVDEFDVIVDGQNQVNDNTDIVFSKQVLTEIFKLTLGRTHHLIGVNVGIIGKLVISIFFPLLPEKIFKNFEMFTSDENEKAISKLREIMPNQTIPDFLGGQNHRTYFQQQNKPKEESSTYEPSIEHSLITDFKRK